MTAHRVIEIDGSRIRDIASLYDELGSADVHYGPAFRGLRSAWRSGDDVCAEVTLPDVEPGAWGMHPALLDAALHAVVLGDFLAAPGRPHLPFALRGVRVHARGATALRVRMARAGRDSVSLALFGEDGALVADGRLGCALIATGGCRTRCRPPATTSPTTSSPAATW